MILDDGGRVRLTPHELNVLRQSAALNGKTINTVATLNDLLAAIIDCLQPSMAADLLEFLDDTHMDEREEAAVGWLIEQDDPNFSPERQAALESWIAESDENRQTYATFNRAWRWASLLFKPK